MSLIASIFAAIGMFFSSLFGHGAPPPQPPQPQAAQEAPAPAQNTPAPAQTTTAPAPAAQTPAPSTASAQTNALTQAELVAMAGPVDLTKLPLGDYKYSTAAPKQGYVYLCNVAQGGGGAQGSSPWIHGNTWDATAKISVEGSVSWPQAKISITTSGSTRTIATNDLPTDHTTGIFPIQSSDPAHQYDANPNSIEPQNDVFNLPLNPAAAATPNCIYGEVGVMTDGVLLLDGFDDEYRDAAAHEVQDSCQAHPHESGVYHYHSLSSCIKDIAETDVIGWAFDGYPITGPEVAPGKYLSTADLDECHGITSAIRLDGKSVTTYHYVMTYDFPYSVACFRGASYEPKPGGGQNGGSTAAQNGGTTAGQSGPPQAAIDACNYKYSGNSCSFSTPNGTVSGTCKTPPNQTSLACVPN